jgi:DNA-binding NtrC family response regulator
MSPSRGKLLIIDDEEDIRDMLDFVLTRDHFEVTTADGGLTGVEAARAQRFDVAITDMRMAGMDGLETLHALKQTDPTIEVIVVTGYASEQTAAECMERGAYGYLRKPFELGDLRALVEGALQRRCDAGAPAER